MKQHIEPSIVCYNKYMTIEELIDVLEKHWTYISINRWKDEKHPTWVVSNTTHPLRFTGKTLKIALEKAVQYIKDHSE